MKILTRVFAHTVTQQSSFLNRYTEEDEWKKDDEGWEGIVDENEHYTDNELKEWEDEYYDYGNYSSNSINWWY